MILLRRIKILGGAFAVVEKWYGAYGVAAGVKEIDHRLAVRVKGHSVVYLHPAGESLVVARLKENEISVCRFNYGFSS